jgi:hypothetical protein
MTAGKLNKIKTAKPLWAMLALREKNKNYV